MRRAILRLVTIFALFAMFAVSACNGSGERAGGSGEPASTTTKCPPRASAEPVGGGVVTLFHETHTHGNLAGTPDRPRNVTFARYVGLRNALRSCLSDPANNADHGLEESMMRWGKRRVVFGEAVEVSDKEHRLNDAGGDIPRPASVAEESARRVDHGKGDKARAAGRENAGHLHLPGRRPRACLSPRGSLQSSSIRPLEPPRRAGKPPQTPLPELDAVTVPTLVVEGERDRFGMAPPRTQGLKA
jgi:hypothetical protein